MPTKCGVFTACAIAKQSPAGTTTIADGTLVSHCEYLLHDPRFLADYLLVAAVADIDAASSSKRMRPRLTAE